MRNFLINLNLFGIFLSCYILPTKVTVMLKVHFVVFCDDISVEDF